MGGQGDREWVWGGAPPLRREPMRTDLKAEHCFDDFSQSRGQLCFVPGAPTGWGLVPYSCYTSLSPTRLELLSPPPARGCSRAPGHTLLLYSVGSEGEGNRETAQPWQPLQLNPPDSAAATQRSAAEDCKQKPSQVAGGTAPRVPALSQQQERSGKLPSPPLPYGTP